MYLKLNKGFYKYISNITYDKKNYKIHDYFLSFC